MRKTENISILAFLLCLALFVAALFLHTSGRVDIPLFHFSQATGSLHLVEEGYKKYNLVGLREAVYSVPQGKQFIHPSRANKLKEDGIFVAHSSQEARRMIDAGTDNIQPKLILVDANFQGKRLYKLGNEIYIVPPKDAGMDQYSEQYAGDSLEDAKKFLMK